ncbi:hypothetical protein MUN84_18745 [Hymenobacter sp. 5516J-16]|uniref:hypothetical protein n=1 Tax=Hymenobacter sp. 5516J-16 TaxID=2932253 RepID=UPI001FD1F58A|nr:hypothetical protein [Hymenobacter sp. 5516J-16]UOQ79207.1 hypothetical protein MUN84_18745 [Hymenobacter sp. 5516J-16]
MHTLQPLLSPNVPTTTNHSPTSEQLLINTLKQNTVISIATGQSPALAQMKLLLVDIQSSLTPAIAHQAPKLFQLRKADRLGEKLLLTLVVFLLKTFQDSLKVKDGMEAADLIETAEMILQKYSHDSLKDVMLALKEAKWSGHNFYNALSGPKVMEVLEKYFDSKAQLLEMEHRQQKAQLTPNLLDSLPTELTAKLQSTVTSSVSKFDEEEYQRQRAAYYAQRVAKEIQAAQLAADSTPEPLQQDAV